MFLIFNSEKVQFEIFRKSYFGYMTIDIYCIMQFRCEKWKIYLFFNIDSGYAI